MSSTRSILPCGAALNPSTGAGSDCGEGQHLRVGDLPEVGILARHTEQRRELLDARPQPPDFLAELRFSEVHNIETGHDRRCSAQPRAAERGTPMSMAMVTSPVCWTRSRRRWS